VIRDGRDSATYWEKRAQPYLQGGDEWRAVTVEAPPAVARRHMRFEERGVRVLERYLPHEGRVLDAGCGVGRWFPLTAPGRSLVGMDFSPPLLERARANPYRVEVIPGDVRSIPAPDASFQAAYTVKVLQCLSDADRQIAVAELLRVTKPGGALVLFEKTRGADGSSASDWLRWGEQAGGRVIEWHANDYALIDRAIARLATLRPRSLGGKGITPSGGPITGPSPVAEQRPGVYGMYMRLRTLALAASLPMESLAERALPRTWAQHGIFAFTK